MKRILVIGKSSYIGNKFKEYIDEYKRTENWMIDFAGAKNHEWKMIDFHGYDAVIHVAALVHMNKKVKENEYREINFELACEVAKKAKESSVLQFVFLSTMAVYGDLADRITEATKEEPTGDYGYYKYLAEQEIMKLSNEQFSVAIIRPPMVYGRECKGNFTRLEKLAGICPIFPDVENQRSIIFIDNLCEYIYMVISRKDSGIGCPHNIHTTKTTLLYATIRSAKGKKTKYIKIQKVLNFMLKKKVKIIDKIFGNYYYDIINTGGRWIQIEPEEYQQCTFEESIAKSV